MSTLRRVIVAAVALGLAACASNPAPASSASSPASSDTEAARWAGTFKPVQMATAPAGPAAQIRAQGTIEITPRPTGPNRVHIELSITAPVPSGTQIAWAVFTGVCGSASPIVAGGETQFPPLEVSGSGAGSQSVDLYMPLDPRAQYHANVYRTSRARNLGDVMMCAPLRVEGR